MGSTPRCGPPLNPLHPRLAAFRRRSMNGSSAWRSIQGSATGVISAEAQRVKELEREVKELRRANEILKMASAFFAQAELDRKLKF